MLFKLVKLEYRGSLNKVSGTVMSGWGMGTLVINS